MSELRTVAKQLKQNEKHLELVEGQIITVNTLPYYSIFGNMQEKKNDLLKLNKAKKEILNERHTLLENMAMAVKKELNIISQQQQFKVA